MDNRDILTHRQQPSVFPMADKLSKLETQIHNKLAYEWKSIFRAFTSADNEDMVELKEFDTLCQKYNTNLTMEELNKIQ